MTNRKLGVYDLVPINGSVMIEMGRASAAPTKENWMSSANTKMDLWEVKIVPD